MTIVSVIIKLKKLLELFQKNDILQPNISDDDFRSSNARIDDFAHNLYVFDIRCQKNFESPNQLK